MRAVFRAVFGGLAIAMLATAVRADEPTHFETVIRPIIGKYCGDCHNDARPKGDLDLDRFRSQNQALQELVVWSRAAIRVEAGEMPPRRAEQPSEEERAALLAWIKGLQETAFDCNRVASEGSKAWFPGYVMSRRLNRDEYQNTLRDLLGVDLSVAEFFPADGAGGEGFDNTGSALFLSAIQIEQYLKAADLAIETALPDAPLTLQLIAHAPKMLADAEELGARRRLAIARARLVPVLPSEQLQPREAAGVVLAQFVERAWRRPILPDELAPLLALFDEATARGDAYLPALKYAMKAALVSPNFLFLAEPEPREVGDYALGDFPLASRLSYFLWGTMPDEELFGLARDGLLTNEGVLERQVRRMLQDPRVHGLGEIFATQWLAIRPLGETKRPDEAQFPEFDAALSQAMRDEVVYFFNRIFREDRSLLELVDARETYVNESLAQLYGISGVQGSEMRLAQLPDENRGGVLGMAAVLTTTSQPLRTSPVLRGKWVLEELLGDRVPPPPPNVPALPESEHNEDGLTLRQRLEAHREQADCASCHNRMDPIGFGLENFDPIGRWRDELPGGLPVDAQGTLPSGQSFSGPRELKAILLERKDDIARNLARKMLGYALGRDLTEYDGCVVDASLTALQAADYRPSSLVTTIVLSYPFRHRYKPAD